MTQPMPVWARGIALVALGVVSTAGATAPAVYNPVVGQPHPDFLLPQIDTRESVALSAFRGKKVLLIHFASW